MAGELAGELAVWHGTECAAEHSVECAVLKHGFELAVGHAVEFLFC